MKPLDWLGVASCSLFACTLLAAEARAQLFTEVDPGLATSLYPSVTWADVDGDGDMDVLDTGSGRHDVAYSTIYKNNAGAFVDSGITLLGLSRAAAAWGDFDGDGDLDLAMTGLTSAGITATQVYRNNGATFAPVAGSFLAVFAGSVAWGDYDGDGDLDLLVDGIPSQTSGTPVTRLYRNDGGTFTSVAHPFPDCYVGTAQWVDYDHDGRMDLCLTGSVSGGGLIAGVWRNVGGGSFTNIGAGLPGTDLGFADWGDFDQDGDLDLALCGNSDQGFITRIYRNDAGTLVDLNAGLLGEIWSSGGWGDFDDDGDLDLMVIGYEPIAQVNRSILYRNDGGSFVDTGAAFHNVYLGGMSWVDYDNDGDLDLCLSGNEVGVNILVLYRNNGAVTNQPPSAPSGLAVSIDGSAVNFGWSTSTDDHTPPSALNYNLRIGTSPGGAEIMSPQALANGRRRLVALGNAQAGLSARIAPLQVGVTYYWSVQAIDASFLGSPFAAEQSFTIAPADVPSSSAELTGELSAAPNPFRGAATLRLVGSDRATSSLRVFDSSGRLVRVLPLARAADGTALASWDGRDELERALPSGLYLCRADGGGPITRLIKVR
ncbi:MAG: FG-GAP-like repeat-containing protein [Candidatus Eisenbacteria bacterium]